MAAKLPLDETECSIGIKMRRLWSAYLHYLSPQIQEVDTIFNQMNILRLEAKMYLYILCINVFMRVYVIRHLI